MCIFVHINMSIDSTYDHIFLLKGIIMKKVSNALIAASAALSFSIGVQAYNEVEITEPYNGFSHNRYVPKSLMGGIVIKNFYVGCHSADTAYFVITAQGEWRENNSGRKEPTIWIGNHSRGSSDRFYDWGQNITDDEWVAEIVPSQDYGVDYPDYLDGRDIYPMERHAAAKIDTEVFSYIEDQGWAAGYRLSTHEYLYHKGYFSIQGKENYPFSEVYERRIYKDGRVSQWHRYQIDEFYLDCSK